PAATPSRRAPAQPAAAPAAAPRVAAPKPAAAKPAAPKQMHRPQPSAYDEGHRLIGDILMEMGSVEQPQIDQAVKKQEEEGAGLLGEILIEMGVIDQNQLMAALCEQSGLDVADLSTLQADEEIIKLVPADMARLYRFVPLYQESDKLVIAIADPTNLVMLDDLKFMLSRPVEAMGADPEIIDAWIVKHYPEESASMEEILGSMDSDLEQLDEVDPNAIDSTQIEKMTNAAPVVKYLNMVLLTAIKDQASDIHFEPFEAEFRIRYRIDGTLIEMPSPPRNLALAITSRIKVMANMDIAERRLPQDDKIELTIQGNRIDLRVSTLPTVFGESVVMRILDRSVVQLDLEKLGMREDELNYFYDTIEQPNGIVLVTGPTGSGKTTTLYAALSKVNSPDIKIITTEDPVEYDIDGLVQVQVNDEIEVTFSKCLRAILRQDPDKILVGEIRDLETASIAIEASLTGHLVFSTLHTNDAPSSITRLVDLGVEAFLVSATLDSIVAQRLVRKICSQCRTEYHPTEEALLEIELTPELVENKRFWFGKKCKNCNNTGYRGRAAIYEILKVNQQMRELIVKKKSTEVIRETARAQGMRTLRESGILKIFDGITTVDEVVRETLAFE
ncbi:MAG: GspE/PulE family protein, partial [Planctomycetota bacterium]